MENELTKSEQYIYNKVGKNSGFSAPTSYFDTLEDTIFTKITEENFSNENAFNIPENYFKDLDAKILAKITSEEKETKVISFKERVFKLIPIAAAASIILFIGLNSFVFNTADELSLDSLSNTDIEYWLDSNTLNTTDIANIFEDAILEENEFLFTDLKDESIEDYLDNTSLLNELN